MSAFVGLLLTSLLLCRVAHGVNTTCQLHNVIRYDDGVTPLNLVGFSYDKFLEVHDNETLRCSLENYCSIIWYHEGMIIDGSADQSPIYRISDTNRTVTIDDVTEAHHGRYECIASNGTSTRSHEFYLNVGGVATSELVIYSSKVGQNSDVYLRQPLELYCYAYNFVDVTWYHGDELIEPEPERVKIQDGGQVLTIEEFALGDEGRYKCVVSNGTHELSREGIVIHNKMCLDYEILLNRCDPSEKNISAVLGSDLNVTCTFSLGVAKGDIRATWYRINSTAPTDQLNDTKFYYRPDFDASAEAGTFYDITQRSSKSNPSCTDQVSYNVTLIIENVTEGTYGYYVVYAFRGATVQAGIIQIIPVVAEPVTPVVRSGTVSFTVGFSVLLVFLVLATWRRYHLDIRLLVKTTREGMMVIDGNNLEKDGYLYDVYIACADADIGVVLERFMPALREKGYSTFLRMTDVLPGEGAHTAIWRCMKASRCCLLLISDHQLNQENIGLAEVQAAVHILSSKKRGIIPVLLHHVTESKMEDYPILKHLLRTNPKLVCRGRDVANPSRFRKSPFFKGIRLALPPPSERSRLSAGVTVRGYLDDEITLVEEDALSYSSNNNPADGMEMGQNAPTVVITTRSQYYNSEETK